MKSSKISKKKLAAYFNLSIGCAKFQLDVSWSTQSIKAFLIYTNSLFYTTGYLDLQWDALLKLGKVLSSPISDDLQADFKLVHANCKEVSDNKVPVSKELMSKLCAAAPLLFNTYNTTLARALFVSAWSCYMHISEYSITKGEHGNKHNLLDDAFLFSDGGLSVSFHSDKASRNYPTVKHRYMPWSILPEGAH